MATRTRNILARTNLFISALLTLATILQLFLLPCWHGHTGAMALAAFILLPVNLPLWSMIHEAVHRHLHPERAVNETAGRLLSILFGIPFTVLRFGHLMHHQYNREWETEIYDPQRGRLGAVLNHYGKMLGGLYISEVAAACGIALLPARLSGRLCRHVFADDRHHDAALRSLLKPANVRQTRLDCLAIAILYGACAAVYGVAWPVLVLIVLGRAFVVSLHDNAYHYGTPRDNSVPAKELKATILFSRLMLNFNHHLTHHRNPGLSWHELAVGHHEYSGTYTESWWRATLAQFRGPIFSRERDG